MGQEATRTKTITEQGGILVYHKIKKKKKSTTKTQIIGPRNVPRVFLHRNKPDEAEHT